MIEKLRNLWAALLVWLASQFVADEPTAEPPEDPNEYHTMDSDGPGGAV